MPPARHGNRSDRVDERMGELIIVEEGVEFPRPKGRISLSVRGYVVGGSVAGLELRLQFRRSAEFGELAVGVSKGRRGLFKKINELY